jgi:signal transduction histidine kinase
VFLSFFLLLKYFLKNTSIKLTEKIAALLILWTPLIAHYLGVLLKAPFDFKPMTFSLWGVVTVYLSFHRQFFNAAPSLVWNIFDVTKEGMAVISMDGSVNVNKAFVEMFGSRSDAFTDFADGLCAGLREYLYQKQEVFGLEAEKDGVYYEISIKNVLGKKNKVLGQLITFNDVSETKQLTLEKERARISSGLHDSMGNRHISLINNLSLALFQPTLAEARPFVDNAIASATASFMMLRKIVEGLSTVNFQKTRLIPLIESVINRISASGAHVDLQIGEDIEELPIPQKEFIYNACQEALTNSIIHGRAENIIIKLGCAAGILRMDIVDDGRGCEKTLKHNGLTIMESRAEALGGKIRFGSPPFGGFSIHAEIPIRAGEQG